jgi:hypothetical protein
MESNEFQQKRWKDMAEYLRSLRFIAMMTVNYPKPLCGPVEERERVLVADLKRWTGRILRRLYGKKFAKRNLNDEFLFVAFIETGRKLGKDHLHLLVRVPYRFWKAFFRDARALWKTTDDVVLDLIHDLEGAVRYASKDLTANPDRVIFSNQFRRSNTAR